jgi:N-[(2S)-2-amino-2-carboxyethyl]-L-glutamate dehydrogenase
MINIQMFYLRRTTMNFKLSIITGKVIKQITDRNTDIIYEIIKNTYLQHEQHNTINPSSFFLRFPDKPISRIIALPAALIDNQKIAGIKWIGSNPDNIKQGFPRASATIILNDYETCYPIAFLEGSIISALRTAYSAVLGATEIKNGIRKATKLGIVGNGLIAKYIYKAFMAQGWEIENLLLFDNNPTYAEKFLNYVEKNKHNTVKIASTLTTLLETCDLIVLTTTTSKHYINDSGLFIHNPVILNISLRDLAPEILLLSNNIVDDVDHVLQANTSPHLALQMSGNKNFITSTIGELISKKIIFDTNKPTILSPMGMGILDIALAHQIYKQALKENLTQEIDNFFEDIER